MLPFHSALKLEKIVQLKMCTSLPQKDKNQPFIDFFSLHFLGILEHHFTILQVHVLFFILPKEQTADDYATYIQFIIFCLGQCTDFNIK